MPRVLGDLISWLWEQLARHGRIRHGSRQARRFAAFGRGSSIAFPPDVLHGVDRIEIGAKTTVGAQATLSTGMLVRLDPDQTDPIVSVGDRCVLGKGISIVAHDRVVIGDDVMFGPYCYVTDQNHGYEELDVPIGSQMWRNNPVHIGSGSWIGAGVIILPGTSLGRQVAVAAGSVVRGEIPDHCVIAGAPARIVRRHLPDRGWVSVDREGNPKDD